MSIQFEGQRAYRHVQALSVDIGTRVSGTEAEKQAADYVAKQLESYGLSPIMLSFDMENEQALEYSFEILDPTLYEVTAMPLVGTPDTPPEGITAEIVFAEFPEEPYVGPHVEGKIVILVNGGILGGNMRTLLKYKPAGIVLVRHTLGAEPNTFHVIRKQGNKPFDLVPTLHISYEDALRLWNEQARRAKIVLKTNRKKGQSYAVYAEVTGTVHPDEIIVVGGHMDTVPSDPGATDNAAGVATMLELARVYAQRGSRRTLRFAAWGSEEGSGGGSLKYILEMKRKHKQEKEAPDYVEGYSKTELERHVLNINLDVLGMSLGSNACYLQGPQALGDYVKALTCELGVRHIIKNQVYGSDNITFAWAGIPAISFVREGVAEQYMHTSRDEISLIDAGQLGVIGGLIDTFLARTAAEGMVWPFERQTPPVTPEQTKNLSGFIRQVIEVMGEDPDLVD
jgi:aminopeptidase YwaD